MSDAIITTSRSNIKNQRVATGDVNGDGVDEAINTSHSNLKILRMAIGDLDGDGMPDIAVRSGFSNSSKTFFQRGDKPTQEQRMPGDPIPGIDVKLGINGSDIKSTQTNEHGEFEFKNLNAGNYHVTVSNGYYISDETLVVDGSLKLGEGSATAYEGKWRSSEVGIKTVRCSDGSCRILTDKPGDYPDASGISLNSLPPGTPVDNAVIWFADDKGKIYKTTTDMNGRIALNGLPLAMPLKMIVNIGVDGSEDVIMKFSRSGAGSGGGIYLMKARHDVAMNAIRNMKG